MRAGIITNQPKYVWQIKGAQFNWPGPMKVMGVLNITPNSFYDGGRYLNIDRAVEQGRQIVKAGADIIDVGGQSSRPYSEAVSEEAEINRVVPVIQVLAQEIDIPISIDTYRASVAKKAIDAGATIINDISGLKLDPEIASVAKDFGSGLVIMHMRGTPQNMQDNTLYKNFIGEITSFLDRQMQFALSCGVRVNQIILDPGIGFSKSPQQNRLLFKEIKKFLTMGRPLLLGPSRKSFIGEVLGGRDPQDRLAGSLACVAKAHDSGIQLIRVHDVRETVDVIKVLDALSVNKN